MTLRVLSLFSGVGGLDWGLEQAGGFETVCQVEIDPWCRRVLERHWPGVQRHDDVRTFDGRAVEHVDLVCGGSPCQDVSVAGRRAGLAGERSGLFFEFARILDEVRPRWFLFENVAGLLSSNEGRDMDTVLGTLADIGYGWCYRVLDARHFGVPQRRRRVFIVGCLGDPARAAQVLLEPDGGEGNPPKGGGAGEAVAALTATGVGTCGADDNQAQAGHLIPVAKPLLAHQNGRRDNAGDENLIIEEMRQVETFVVVDETADTLRSHPRPGSNSLGQVVMTIGLGSDPLHTEGVAQPVTGRNGDPGVVAVAGVTFTGNDYSYDEDVFPPIRAEAGPPGVPLAIGFATSALDTPGEETAPPLKANPNGQGTGCSASALVAYPVASRGRGDSYQAELGEEGVYNSLRAGDTSRMVAYSVSENQLGRVWESDHVQALNAGGGKPRSGYPTVRDAMAVRRLTPDETERLMGWPNGWTDGSFDRTTGGRTREPLPKVSDSVRYRMCGNGIVAPVAEWIGRRIMEFDR